MYQSTTIIGNLGNDPDMRYTPSGVPVCSFSLAVNRSWTDNDGNRQEKVTWFRVTAWRKLAEVCTQYLAKGRQVLVIGDDLEARAFTDRAGENRASLELTAREVKFLSGRDTGSNGNSADPMQGETMESTKKILF